MIEWKQRVQKLHRFNVEMTYKNPRGELIDISSVLKVESTSRFPQRFDVIISMWIRPLKSMKSRQTFHVEFRWPIDEDVSIALMNEVVQCENHYTTAPR